MKICPNCSNEFEDNLNFCRHDGTALESKIAGQTCPQCGKAVEVGRKFCRHCGASLKADSPLQLEKPGQTPPATEGRNEPIAEARALIESAEDYLRRGSYKEAISTLEGHLKTDPKDQEARLLHLYASVKLYNVYGYERQIESLRNLTDLTEKEREIVREVFLLRADEAQKRGNQNEAREYQRLATRVILGQPLVEPVQEVAIKETPLPSKKAELRSVPRKLDERAQVTPTRIPTSAPTAGVSPQRNPRRSKSGSRLLISFAVVFGLAGVLIAGMLGYYASKQGVGIKDLFATKSRTDQTPRGETGAIGPSVTPQVLRAEQLGFRVSGAGATDVNRMESLISEQIESQLGPLRQLYQQEVQQKPDLMGGLTLQLTISPAGSVTKVEEFGSRITDKEFKQSVIQEAYKWRFPEASSGLVKVDYPLLFVPPGMDVATLIKWEQVVGPKGPERTDPGKVPSVPKVDVHPPPVTKPRPPQPPQVVEKVIEKVIEKKVIVGTYEVLYPTSVYSEPREDSQRVARIEAGTRVNVVDVLGDWLEVRSKHGRPPGFIKKDSAMPLGSSR